jgi:hypothetical protein
LRQEIPRIAVRRRDGDRHRLKTQAGKYRPMWAKPSGLPPAFNPAFFGPRPGSKL